jgi:DNA (cytosine-5)-methyltransferase 1
MSANLVRAFARLFFGFRGEVNLTVKVFDFFSGCGGTSAGLRAAGMQIMMGLDFDRDSASTFKTNFPEADFIDGDIRQIGFERLAPLVTACAGHPTLFAGCAPCQPFSKQNQRKGKDERIDLLAEFGRFVAHFKPDYVLVENVPGMQNYVLVDDKSSGKSAKVGKGKQSTPDEYAPFKLFTTLLDENGYQHKASVISSQDYGVPQRRTRLVLIATRYGTIDLPGPTHGPNASKPQPYLDAWSAIKHLPALRAGESHPNIENHACAGLSELNLKRMKATPEGGDRRNWTEDLKLECHKKADAVKTKGKSAVHMDVYGRIRKNQPASGLTTRCISLSNGRFGHPDPDQHRALSVREAACLQTFPPNFVFVGSLNSTAKQVGNAVPVLLAQCLGMQVLEHLNKAMPQQPA